MKRSFYVETNEAIKRHCSDKTIIAFQKTVEVQKCVDDLKKTLENKLKNRVFDLEEESVEVFHKYQDNFEKGLKIKEEFKRLSTEKYMISCSIAKQLHMLENSSATDNRYEMRKELRKLELQKKNVVTMLLSVSSELNDAGIKAKEMKKGMEDIKIEIDTILKSL